MTHDVVILGAGFSGLCAGIQLRAAGVTDFVLVDQGDEIGGTWRDNVYPGCACDVRSHLYSYSFAPNPDWTRAFAPQAEIQGYLLDVTERHALRPHLRLGEEVLGAVWEESSGRWIVRTSRARYEARVLVSALGALSVPSVPPLPGLERFEGPTFHSARWRYDVDLSGRRVAVIGTGASAVQFVPAIAPRAGRVSVFQRTPPWILPRRDRAITALERWLFAALPVTQRLARAAIYWKAESFVLGFARNPRLVALGARAARRHLARQVRDPTLRAVLTPDYALGCKRVLLSDDYYPALTRENVEVVTDPIEEVTARGIRTALGRHVDADVIVHGTGFAVHELARPGLFRGRDGLDLADVWKARASAYKGTAVAGFPNLFLLLGPNTGLGHTSMVLMIEAQVAYLVDALRRMRAEGWRTVEVDAAAQRAWNEGLDARLGGTVWQTGCRSWYLDEHGHNTTIWPGFTFSFARATARFDAERYVTTGGPT